MGQIAPLSSGLEHSQWGCCRLEQYLACRVQRVGGRRDNTELVSTARTTRASVQSGLCSCLVDVLTPASLLALLALSSSS